MAYTTIDDPSAYFHTLTYAGNGSNPRSLTNSANAGDFKPDWLWIKNRSNTYDHAMFDSSRGVDKLLKTNQNNEEGSSAGYHNSFDTNGFTVTANGNVNNNAENYVAWQWIANGGTTASNSDGGVTGTIQANTTAGFSIILYTGTGSTNTVGHGLGDTPDWIIYKRRSGGTRDWIVYHNGTGSKGMILNSTGQGDTASSIFGGNTPTSTTIPIGSATETNTSSENHVAYAFAEKQGFSKFGGYTGNGDADGPFVYTGFSPAWIMIKGTDVNGYWVIIDTKRNYPNISGGRLGAQANDAEYGSSNIDFCSNGFKIRASGSDSDTNNDGSSYIYMAFADSPFVSSEGVPTTAR